jgi:hypothetical protein
MRKNDQKGFVAVVSVIIISMILLVLVVTLSTSSFFNRYNVYDSENKRVSLALAEACANTAMLKVAQDSGYTPITAGECVSVSDSCPSGARVCKICSVSNTGGVYTIVARAVYGTNKTYSTVQVSGTLTTTNFAVTSWQELASNPVPACTLP